RRRRGRARRVRPRLRRPRQPPPRRAAAAAARRARAPPGRPRVTPLFGFLLPLFVYALVLALHLVVPARRVDGYVRDAATDRPLRYRLNGLAVAAITVALYVLAARRGLVAWDLFWTWRWHAAAGACVLGLVFTLAI